MLPSELAKQIDDMMHADLLYWRDLWFGRLLLSTKIVAVGLVLEGPELMYEMVSIARSRISFLRYRIVLLEEQIDRAKLVAFIGWILIAIGVAGEWVTEAMVSDADNNIQEFTSIQVTEAQKEAAFALEGTANATVQVAALQRDVANAQTGMAKQQERAAKAEKELLEERQRTAIRDIPIGVQRALSTKLTAFAGQRVIIEVFPVTFESQVVAGQIESILSNAKWDVPRTVPKLLPVPPKIMVAGLGIFSTPDEKSKTAAAELFRLLLPTSTAGTLFPSEPPGVFLPDPADSRVVILVGDKPMPLRSWVK